ncbi:MAG: tetratricopeptide repeat protein [Planctomycetota bacterium]|nr:tetratricopeptide repeat protein [Planctomycetota bacterium]
MTIDEAIPRGLPRRILLGILLVGLLIQIGMLVDGARANPLARNPLNDAAAYWDWGGEIARGELVGSTPFLSAPLYPYVVGLVRAFGGGILALGFLQIALHIATAWLVARCTSARFGWAAGILGAGLYLLLRDPAFHTARVLNCTLQAFATAWIWERAIAAGERLDVRRATWLGLAIGLGSLANPTFAPLCLALPLWLCWKHGWRVDSARRGVLTAAVSLATIAPATLHNWLAGREFIPLSAQAGLGFFHGNAPGAEGIFHAAEGVSTDRVKQNLDARDVVRGETDGSWKQTSDAYLRRGLAYWKSEPVEALQLTAKKVWWFFSGRVYGDVYVADLEADDGLARALAFAPMPVAWWTVPAALVLWMLARRPREHAPEILLFLATFLVVALFWYSPRYRMPVVPLIAGFGGAALVAVGNFDRARARAGAVAAAWVVSFAAAAALRAGGRDAPDSFRPQFQMQVGDAYMAESSWSPAADRYELAARLGARGAAARRANALLRLGRGPEALEALRRAVAADPANAVARRGLAIALVESGDLPGARREFETAIASDPNDWEANSGLGNVLLALGDTQGAIVRQRRAIELSPGFANAHANLGRALEAQGDAAAAELAFREALRIDADSTNAAGGLSDLLIAGKRWREGLDVLRAWVRRSPSDRGLARTLAWWLATCPEEATRDPREALAFVAPDLGREDLGPQDLDTLAAVLAANRRFDEARALADRALSMLRRDGPSEPIPEVEARAALYATGQPYVLPP